MSVYNGEEYLREAIDSILQQSFGDFEFIIIDDGSKDNSAQIVRTYSDRRIFLIQQDNKGLARALNKGLSVARGKYIARLDADDIALPERLKLQYEFMEEHPMVSALGSNAIITDQNGKELYTSSQLTSWPEIRNKLPHTPFFHSSVMFRREIAFKCGGYYEAIRQHFEDVILWNKLAQYGELRNLPQVLIRYRLVPGAISNRTVKTGKIMAGLYKNILANKKLSEEDEVLLKEITKPASYKWKMSNYHLNIGKIFLERKLEKSNAAINFLKSIFYNPANSIAWFNLMLLLFPVFVIRKWKQMRGMKM